ncbi:hypothetical protein IWQ62_000324 [Dispira parvispora]|uniref:Uncharacterized protein n=1 Tax=Dispira parvispora TaxID=1520584 RepID=A0A9W8E663_9FUNG|nr:hypothetical protein IWQ62_000324 [Dispira parvispora]
MMPSIYNLGFGLVNVVPPTSLNHPDVCADVGYLPSASPRQRSPSYTPQFTKTRSISPWLAKRVQKLTERASRWLNKRSSKFHPQPVDEDDWILIDYGPEQHDLTSVTVPPSLNRLAVGGKPDSTSTQTSRRSVPFCLPPIADACGLSPCLATRIQKLAKKASGWIKHRHGDGHPQSANKVAGTAQVGRNEKQEDLAMVTLPLTLNHPKVYPDLNYLPALTGSPRQSGTFRLPLIANIRGLLLKLTKAVEALKKKAYRWINRNQWGTQQQPLDNIDCNHWFNYNPEDHDLFGVTNPPFLDLPYLGTNPDGYLSPFPINGLFGPFGLPCVPNTYNKNPWVAQQVHEFSVRADHCFVNPFCSPQVYADTFSPTPLSGLAYMASELTMPWQLPRTVISYTS